MQKYTVFFSKLKENEVKQCCLYVIKKYIHIIIMNINSLSLKDIAELNRIIRLFCTKKGIIWKI